MQVPRLTPAQKKEFDELKSFVGWSHLIEPVKVSIDLKQLALLNFKFERNDEADITKKSILEFENIQRELLLLKEFFSFLETGGIIEEEKDLEVFEVPKTK